MCSLCQPRARKLKTTKVSSVATRANLAPAGAAAQGANFAVVEHTPPDYRMEALLHSRGTGEVQTIVKRSLTYSRGRRHRTPTNRRSTEGDGEHIIAVQRKDARPRRRREARDPSTRTARLEHPRCTDGDPKLTDLAEYRAARTFTTTPRS